MTSGDDIRRDEVRRILDAAAEPPAAEDRRAILEAARPELARLRRRAEAGLPSPGAARGWWRLGGSRAWAVAGAAAILLLALLLPRARGPERAHGASVRTWAEHARGETPALPIATAVFEGLE